jgi:hypothetical protein
MKIKSALLRLVAGVAAAALLVLLTSAAPADEGMWTFDNPPTKLLQEKYGFTPTQEWLDHVRLSSIRFNDGGTGSFVSPDGLVMTNHHVAVGQLQKVSTIQKDYVLEGFHAATPAEEIKAPDLELNVLRSMENVTDRVMASFKPGMSAEQALKARRAEIARIEAESLKGTGLRSNVISLYGGAEYWLYRYKVYTDVRIVFAPPRQVAYFGGDWDNFTYPRFDLDVAFFRVYENDQPVKSDDYFRWHTQGAAMDELVFVPGNPGSTDRLYTMSELAFERDHRYPMVLKYINGRLAALGSYANKGPEEQRRALVQIFGLENAKKAMTGEYEQGLLNKAMMDVKAIEEKTFREQVEKNPVWRDEYGQAWPTIADVVKKEEGAYKAQFYERLTGSQMADLAMTIVFYVIEVAKPDAERLPGYHESQLQAVRFRLLSPAPIYLDLEAAALAGQLQMALDELGRDNPFIQLVLGSRSPEDVAQELVYMSHLNRVPELKKLMEGGLKALEASKDPLIVLARKLEPRLRQNIKWTEDNIDSVLVPARQKIGQARFAVYGHSLYPDATFTLRLAYGTVAGYPMNGTRAPHKTTLYGLYDRSLGFDKSGDWALPEAFWKNVDKLDLATPVNFVSSCDIIGGNSGSPVINKNAEIVGLIFDGNIESLAGRFFFDGRVNRAVAVHPAYIIEALRKLYGASALADEIEGKK